MPDSWGSITAYKRKSKSVRYRYVSEWQNGRGGVKWVMKVSVGSEHTACKFYDTEMQAARAVDLYLIRLGKDPVNGTLKRKTA